MVLPCGSSDKEPICQCRKHKRWAGRGGGDISLGQEDPLEEDMARTSILLPRESHGQRHLAGYSPKGCKELDMIEEI